MLEYRKIRDRNAQWINPSDQLCESLFDMTFTYDVLHVDVLSKEK